MGTAVERRLDHDWFSRPLPANVSLGERTWLHSSYAFLHYQSLAAVGLRVGHDTGIYHGTFFELGPEAEVQIGNYATLVGAIFATNGKVSVGDYALIAHEVVIADADWPLPGDRVRAASSTAGRTAPCRVEIADNVWIGAQSILLGSLRIGEGAIIGAGSLVTEDVPAYSIWAGNPGRIVGSIGRA